MGAHAPGAGVAAASRGRGPDARDRVPGAVRPGKGRPAARAAVLAAVLAVAAGGCREAPEPFAALDRAAPPTDGSWRLTFSPGRDQAPSWSAGGDTLYYTAEGYGELPRTPGVLLGIPFRGGAARPIVEAIQLATGTRRYLAATAVSPDGERLAFAEVWFLRPDPLCATIGRECEPETAETTPAVRLGEVVLRARRFDETGPIEADPALRVSFPGVTVLGGVRPVQYEVKYYPFHERFDETRALVFRPTWAPDGQRLAFSDGLSIRIWTVGQATAPAVPGTEDGVYPAWSPDGEWIAFTRLTRADSTGAYCTYPTRLDVACTELRTDYLPGPRMLVLVRPDGGARVELGEGDSPAWAPDGSVLYFRREDSIWRSAADGSGAAPVPGTEFGREPAVSPDGRYLAFSRRSTPGNYDIWVVSLDPAP